MKAIIKTGGKQYYVEENSRIYVEKLDVEADKELFSMKYYLLMEKLENHL